MYNSNIVIGDKVVFVFNHITYGPCWVADVENNGQLLILESAGALIQVPTACVTRVIKRSWLYKNE